MVVQARVLAVAWQGERAKRLMRLRAVVFGALLALATPASVQAAGILYNFGVPYSGSPPNSTDQPWVSAEFTDIAPGTVRLTLSAQHLTDKENLDLLYFNLNSVLTPTSLTFSPVSSSGTFDAPDISLGLNAFKAGGD